MTTPTQVKQNTSIFPYSLFVVLALLSTWISATASEVPLGSAQTIEAAFVGVRSVRLADIDKDGDLDIVGAALSDGDVSWFENTAGDASAWTERSIDTNFQNASGVFVADINGDGSVDVIGTSFAAQISWWEGAGASWTEHSIDSSLLFSLSVVAGDVDSDGDVDVVAALSGGNEIHWWENAGTFGDGSGGGEGSSWTEHTVDASISYPRTVILTDIDADGDLDIVAAAEGANTVSWWENSDGAGGSWTEHSIATGFMDARSVFAGDIDGDGDLDVVGAAALGNDITWWENSGGAGSWTAHAVEGSFSGAAAVSLIDLDNDGDLDIIGAAENADAVAWWENDGTPGDDIGGDGNSWTEHTIDTAFNGATALTAGDLDGDGDMDVIGAALNAGDIAWWENETIHRNALYPTEHVVDEAFGGARSLQTADINGDGFPDVVGAASDDNRIAWWESDGTPGDDSGGDGNSWTERLVEDGFSGPVSVFAADVDYDGDLDIVGALNGSNDISWWNNTAGDGTTWTRVAIDNSINGPAGVAAADLDRDGDLDVVGAASGAGSVSWWENPDGGGGGWTEHGIDATFAGAGAVFVADINGDGPLDVVGAAETGNLVSWWQNDGTPGDDSSWTEHSVGSSFSGASAVYAADIDLDGDLDVVAAAASAGEVAWFENTNGVGTSWTKASVDASLTGARAVYVRDLDYDGDLDILATGETVDAVACYENTAGDGSSWEKHTIDASFGGASTVVVADLDQDGDIDVLGAAATDDTVSWWENRGGQFGLPTTNTAPLSIDDNNTDDVLAIEATHNGRAGDTDIELVTLELLFEETDSDPLTTTEANNIIANLFVYKDDGDGDWDTPDDTLVSTIATLALTDGVETITFSDADANVQVAHGTPETYFVVVSLTANAHEQTPNTFQVSHVTESSSTAEDGENDIALTLAFAANVTSENVLAGDGASPEVVSAAAQDSTTVRVVFSEPMTNDADLVNMAFYTFTGGGASLTASSVTRISATTVDVTVNEMTSGASYTVAVSTSGPTDLVGNTVDPGANSAGFTGLGTLPQVSSAAAQDSMTVRVVFSEPMTNNAHLVNPVFYTFTGGGASLTASSVTRVNATIVDVTVNEMTDGASYTAVVATGSPTDLAGNAVDPAANSAGFTGIGVRPRVSSATAQDSTRVQVVFNEAMLNNPDLVNKASYTFSGGEIEMTAQSVARSNETTVVITVVGMLDGIEYTVSVATASPTDLAGNPVDPDFNSAQFIGTSAGSGETFYVDATRPGPGNGSQEDPFTTIGDAVAATAAGRHDLIRVKPSTYLEHVTLKSTTTLLGEQGSYHTLISGSEADQDVLTMADACIVRGFSMGDAGIMAAVVVPEDTTATVTNCVLYSSETGLHARQNASVTFVNNTVYNHTTGVWGESGATFNPLKNSIFNENTTGISADPGAIVGGSYNDFFDNGTDLDGPSASPTDISEPPSFVDPTELNFHLKAASLCRNAGDPGIAFNDLDGSRNDMGADGGPHGVRDQLAPTAVADAMPDAGLAPLHVIFDGSGSTDEWGIASYSWDWDNNDGIQEDSSGSVAEHWYDSPGVFVATLTVTDNSGNTAQTSLDITVSAEGNDPPTATASVTPIAGPPPLTLELTGVGNDPDGGAVTFEWDLDGDGQPETPGQNQVFILEADAPLGSYTFTLTVTDNEDTSRKARAYFTATDGPVDHAELVLPDTDILVEVTEPGSAMEGATVFLPERATADPVVLAIGPVDNLPPVVPPAIGPVFHLGPTAIQFAQPVTVSVRHPSLPSHPSELSVLFFDPEAGQWRSDGISNVVHTVGGPTHTVSFDTTHLTVFVVTPPLRTGDINLDGAVTAVDVQLVINAALDIDISPFSGDTNGDGKVDAVDIQRVINAALDLLP